MMLAKCLKRSYALRWLATVILAATAGMVGTARAEPTLACGHFASADLADLRPAARDQAHAAARHREILAALRAGPHDVLYLGDSLTERWPAGLWQSHFGQRGALNAGINGDRTEHLLWRLGHGTLDGPPPRLVLILIGTNDLGHGRSESVAAEGIRADLEMVRTRLPAAEIVLIGLLPRGESPADPMRARIAGVNRLISQCADGSQVVFADVGNVLLDPAGRLARAIAPDGLHFSEAGYVRLARALDPFLERSATRR